MGQFKNNPNYNLYYSDTDSIIIDKPLPEDKIGNNLGQVKLECTIEKAVFLAPKVYGLITKDGKEIIKVKGVTKDVCDSIHFKDLQDLLYKDSRKDLTQRKWFKSIFAGTISVLDVAYQLKVTNNKRMAEYMFYDEAIFSGTQPFNYSDLEVNSHNKSVRVSLSAQIINNVNILTSPLALGSLPLKIIEIRTLR